MKVDYDYIKNLLFVLTELEVVYPHYSELEKEGIEINDQFVFHIEILNDNGLITTKDRDNNLGFILELSGEGVDWIDIPIRITAKGSELYEALNKVEIWELVKSEFKKDSITTVFTVSKTMLKKLAKDKITKYLGSL